MLDPATCTWDDIVEAFDSARVKYDKKAQGFYGITRKVWRSTGNHASTVTAALDVLPDEMMVNTLKAGLIFIVTVSQGPILSENMLLIILQMAKDAAKKRDAILAAFADIPLQFGLAEKKRRRFPDNASLRELSMELHDALMVAIPRLISHLLPKKRCKVHRLAPAPFNHKPVPSLICGITVNLFPFINTPTEDDIEEILETIRKPCDALKQQVKDILEELMVDLSRTSNVIRDTALKTYAMAEGTDRKIDNWMRDFQEKFDDVKAGNAAVIEGCNNALLQTLIDVIPQLRGSLLSAGGTGISFMRLEDLINSLQVSVDDLLVKDLATAFSQSKILEREVQAQSVSLLQSPQFQRWYYSEGRDVLLVDGSMADTGVPTLTITPLSNICATLAAAARILPNATPLVFFSGLHTSAGDPLAGPNGMVRALIRMVIHEISDSHIPNLGFINTPQYAPALRAHDLSTLCRTLRELIYQLNPLTKLYCVIDGITWCERREWIEELNEVVQTLISVAQDIRRGPVLKLLVTCPVRSQEVIRNFPFNAPEHQFILMGPQGYESEFVPERVMELEMRRRWQAEQQRSTYSQKLDDEEEDYC